MSLLTIVSGACARLSIPIPSAVVGTTDASVKQLYYLAQQEGKALARMGSWKVLMTEKTFSATAAAAQTDAIPTDLDWIIPETMFNRTLLRRVCGPVSEDEWQTIQSGLATLVDPVFRIRGTSLLIYPTPTAGNTIAYEYITKNWCQSSGGTGQAAWAADSDTALINEELHTLGLIWRFKRAKGLDYSQEISEYQMEVKLALTRDGVRPRVSSDWGGKRFVNGADDLAEARPDVIVAVTAS